VGEAARAGCDDLVFADAVDFGGEPGALLLAGTEELLARPVGTSTHRVPLSVLAQYAEGLGVRAWLLGVQPASLRLERTLSPEVAGTLEALVEILERTLGARRGDEGGRGCAASRSPSDRSDTGDGDAHSDGEGSSVTSRARARSRACGEAGVES
jgi:hypothetical protein